MKWYFKKSEILREMGKNPKDIRLLDRMIARGEIVEEGGKWRFANDTETESGQKVDIDIDAIVDKKLSSLVQEYKDRIHELEEELKKKSVTTVTQGSEYAYTQDDMDYVNKIIEGQDIQISELQDIILKIYNRLGKTYSWQDFKTAFGITFTVDGENE